MTQDPNDELFDIDDLDWAPPANDSETGYTTGNPDSPITAFTLAHVLLPEEVAAVRFHLAKRGYSFTEVETFVTQVQQSLTKLHQDLYDKDLTIHNTREELTNVQNRASELQATIEVFRANGDPLTTASGEYITESTQAEITRLTEDVTRLTEQLTDVQAALATAEQERDLAIADETALREYVDTTLAQWNNDTTADTPPTIEPDADAVTEPVSDYVSEVTVPVPPDFESDMDANPDPRPNSDFESSMTTTPAGDFTADNSDDTPTYDEWGPGYQHPSDLPVGNWEPQTDTTGVIPTPVPVPNTDHAPDDEDGLTGDALLEALLAETPEPAPAVLPPVIDANVDTANDAHYDDMDDAPDFYTDDPATDVPDEPVMPDVTETFTVPEPVTPATPGTREPEGPPIRKGSRIDLLLSAPELANTPVDADEIVTTNNTDETMTDRQRAALTDAPELQ